MSVPQKPGDWLLIYSGDGHPLALTAVVSDGRLVLFPWSSIAVLEELSGPVGVQYTRIQTLDDKSATIRVSMAHIVQAMTTH